MADCKEIDAALSKLTNKIDNLNNKLRDLDSRAKNAEKCCNNGVKQGEKEIDLSDILLRLAKLEKDLKILDENERNNYKLTEEMAKSVSSLDGFLKTFNRMFNFNFD